MKIAVLGATGGTGLEVIRQALERGYKVVALARTPSKLQIKHEKLKIHEANIFNEESLSQFLPECDALISCLGFVGRNLFQNVTIYSQSMPCITKAMRKCKVPRLAVITSWCTVKEPGNPKILEWFLKPLFIGRALADMAIMEQFLYDNCSDINYTIVRPPGLSDKPRTDKNIAAVQGQFVKGVGNYISRADVARFMLDSLSTEKWDKKAVAIGY